MAAASHGMLSCDRTHEVNPSFVQDPPIVTLQNNQTEVMGFFGRVWKVLEENMNFR
jgi:hypothetical protein